FFRLLVLLRLCIPRAGVNKVRDAVPGIVDADEKEQQRGRSNAEQGFAEMHGSSECRTCQHHVCRKRQRIEKYPIPEIRLVCGLLAHAVGDDERISDAAYAY